MSLLKKWKTTKVKLSQYILRRFFDLELKREYNDAGTTYIEYYIKNSDGQVSKLMDKTTRIKWLYNIG